jgi:hypothetical protein
MQFGENRWLVFGQSVDQRHQPVDFKIRVPSLVAIEETARGIVFVAMLAFAQGANVVAFAI